MSFFNYSKLFGEHLVTPPNSRVLQGMVRCRQDKVSCSESQSAKSRRKQKMARHLVLLVNYRKTRNWIL